MPVPRCWRRPQRKQFHGQPLQAFQPLGPGFRLDGGGKATRCARAVRHHPLRRLLRGAEGTFVDDRIGDARSSTVHAAARRSRRGPSPSHAAGTSACHGESATRGRRSADGAASACGPSAAPRAPDTHRSSGVRGTHANARDLPRHHRRPCRTHAPAPRDAGRATSRDGARCGGGRRSRPRRRGDDRSRSGQCRWPHLSHRRVGSAPGPGCRGSSRCITSHRRGPPGSVRHALHLAAGDGRPHAQRLRAAPLVGRRGLVGGIRCCLG